LAGGFLLGLIFGRSITAGTFGIVLGLLAWALIWDFPKLNKFKADAAAYIEE
jgi:hypothetical protein